MKDKKIINRSRVWFTFIGIILMVIIAILVIYPKLPDYLPGVAFFNKFKPHLGLDLQGGAHLVYQADLSKIDQGDTTEAMAGVRDVIERRVNAFGVSEPIVQTSGVNRLIIELAGVFDVKQAIKQIGETPLLEFKEQNQNINEPVAVTADQQKQMDDYNKKAEEKAKSILQQVKIPNANFAELAKKNSEDEGSAQNNGDLGFAAKGKYVPEFDQALWALKDGSITKDLVKTQFGYHIIKRVATRTQDQKEEVQASHILIKTISADSLAPAQSAWMNTKLTGKNLQKAEVVFDQNNGQPNVSLVFDAEGKQLFAEITKRNVGKPVAIFLDGTPISTPTVQEEITQGEARITGKFNVNEAKLLSQRLNAGALPVPITLISQQTIGPTLGQVSLNKSVIAGIIGLLMVAIFMIVFYRLPGLLAVIALLIYTAVSLAIFEIWPITLTLAGITGFILSIGMAVDANVLIFERMKEELHLNKPLGTAVEEGFWRAWTSIKDSNISSLITCLILAWFGTSLIKGFAITLAIGILISMFSAITVTRTFLRLIVKKHNYRWLWLFSVKINNKSND